MSVITLILSLNCFSQTAIDSTEIVLPTDIVRKVVVDLIEGDAAKEALQLQSTICEHQDSIIRNDKETIEKLQEKVLLQEQVILLHDAELLDDRRTIESLQKELKRQLTFKSIFTTTTGVSVVALIISLII